MSPVSSGCILVADIGGTAIKFGYNVAGVPNDFIRLFPTAALQIGDPISTLAGMVEAVIAESGLHPDVFVSTVPGCIGRDQDTVIFAGNIRSLDGRRLATDLSSALNIPVILERDAILALMGETAAGAGKGTTSTLAIYFGTGVGGAYIENGQPFRGGGWALEIGSMPYKTEGRQLGGLRKDGLESYASGRALLMIADRYDLPIATVFAVADRHPDSPLARDIEVFVEDQAIAIGIACALFSPEVVIVGGGVCEMDSFPKNRLKAMVAERAPFDQMGIGLDMRWAELGWKGVLYGAPTVAADFFSRQLTRKSRAVQ